MTNEIELREMASNLYDGGWRSSDASDIKAEYDLSEREMEVIIEALIDYESEDITKNLYGLSSCKAADTTKAIVLKDPSVEELEQYLHGLTRIAFSYVEGHVDEGTEVLVPYDGTYGKGFIVCYPKYNFDTSERSTKYMNVAFYVKENK